MARIPRDEYYLKIAFDVAKRGTCTRRMIGAVIVAGDVIVSTGYNGNPRGMPHCDEIGCIRDELDIPSGERMEICTGVHAEMNALIFAGKSASGGTLYSTIVPCSTCAKMIINAGLKRVVFSDGYPDTIGYVLLEQAGVEVKKLEMREESLELQRMVKGPQIEKKPMKDIEEMRDALYKKMTRFSKGEIGSYNQAAVRFLEERAKKARKRAGSSD